MKVINSHQREINQTTAEIAKLFNTLSSDNDCIIATDKWPPLRLDKGLKIGSKGGHGPIKYFVTDFQADRSVTFQFDMTGFNGFHRFDIHEIEPNKTEISHIIEMNTAGIATLKWIFVIRWLHDAFIEDAFDKVENQFSTKARFSKWNCWVRFLRKLKKSKRN